MTTQNTCYTRRLKIENLDTDNQEGVLNHDNLLIVTNKAIPEFLNAIFQINAFIIVLCESGSAKMEINCEDYSLTESNVLVSMPENRIRVLDFSDNCDIKTIVISPEVLTHMTTDMLQKMTFYMKGKSSFLFSIPEMEMKSLVPYHTIISNSLSHIQIETDEVIKNLLQAFIFSILGLMEEYGKDDFLESYRMENRTSRLLYEKFMKLLSECPPGKHPLKYYSEKLFVSSKYLSLAVSRYSGKGPIYWIDLYVVSEAKHLLKYSGLTVKQIAFQLNFKTQAAFGKFFKKFTSCSPAQYSKGNYSHIKEIFAV